jgi:hypothetical protein
MFLRQRILLCGAACWFGSLAASAQATHYSVKVTPDFERHILYGEEQIEFSAAPGVTEWQKKEGLKITETRVAGGKVTVGENDVRAQLDLGGKHVLRFKYEASPVKGFAGSAVLLRTT